MREIEKLRLAKFFRSTPEQAKLMKEVRRGVPIAGALRTRRLPVKNGEALLRNHFGSDEVEQAKQAGKAEMKKADKSLREWGNSHRRGIDAASKKL